MNNSPETKKIEFFEHPCFKEMKDFWETCRDLYKGDHSTLIAPKYLWPHELELSNEGQATVPGTNSTETIGQRIRRIRAMRSQYFNGTEPVISNLIAMAFQGPIVADDEMIRMLGDDIKNIDGKNTSLESFITGPTSIAHFLNGQVIIHVDAPSNPGTTRTDEIQSGFRPFMEVLQVLDVPDYQLAESGPRSGQYDWVRYEYDVIAPRRGPSDEPKKLRYTKIISLDAPDLVVVRVYEQQEKKNDWKLVSEQALVGLEEVPVSTCFTNESWVKDVLPLQLVLFNLMSAHYNQLNTQAFQRIFVAGLDAKSAIAISEYAISAIPLEAKPFIVEPSSTEAIVDGIQTTHAQIAQVAFNRTRSLPANSKEAPGADTIAEMNAELVALLKEALEEIEAVVNSALKHYAIFKLGPEKGKAFKGKVTFTKDIDTKAVSDRLELFMAYRDEIRKVLAWRKAELKKAASEMGYEEEDLKDIHGEIDKLKEEPVIDPMTGLGPFVDGGNGQKDVGPGSESAGG